jgi:hypothetical protein
MKSARNKIKSAVPYRRLNLTLPSALYDEAVKLCSKYHFAGPSELFAHLIREAIFNPNSARPSSIILNEESGDEKN